MKTVPQRFEKCPACGRKLKWEHVEVFGGGDPSAHLPLESYDEAECTCGYEYVRNGGTMAQRERGEPMDVEA